MAGTIHERLDTVRRAVDTPLGVLDFVVIDGAHVHVWTERDAFTSEINGVMYRWSVHVRRGAGGWKVEGRPNMSREAMWRNGPTENAVRRIRDDLGGIVDEWESTDDGASALAQAVRHDANNDVVRLGEQLREVDDYRATVTDALARAKARMAALDAGHPDPGSVAMPDNLRSL